MLILRIPTILGSLTAAPATSTTILSYDERSRLTRVKLQQHGQRFQDPKETPDTNSSSNHELNLDASCRSGLHQESDYNALDRYCDSRSVHCAAVSTPSVQQSASTKKSTRTPSSFSSLRKTHFLPPSLGDAASP